MESFIVRDNNGQAKVYRQRYNDDGLKTANIPTVRQITVCIDLLKYYVLFSKAPPGVMYIDNTAHDVVCHFVAESFTDSGYRIERERKKTRDMPRPVYS